MSTDIFRRIETITDFATLVPVAHELATLKGWWPTNHDDRPTDEIIANYHAEISEAWEEYRGDRLNTWYQPDGKPEGFFVELADLVIRIADATGSEHRETSYPVSAFDLARVQHAERAFYKYIDGRSPAGVICELHEAIAECQYPWAVYICERYAKNNGVDFYAIVREKMAYNAGRPYRHGGKLA